MENKYVDILIIICCIIGIFIGMIISDHTSVLFNFVFYIFASIGLLYCFEKIIKKSPN
jgi:hypothetical protein